MKMTVNIAGQVRQIKLGTNKALWNKIKNNP